MEPSVKYRINKADMWKVFRGFLLLLAGAVLTYASQIYTQIDYTIFVRDTAIDLTPIATITIGSILEVARRFLTDYSSKG